MKNIINWLFKDFLYNVYEYIGSKVCSFVSSENKFQLFVNGVAVPASKFGKTDLMSVVEQSTPAPSELVQSFDQYQGQSTLTLNAGDRIQLRYVQVSKIQYFPKILSEGDGTVTSSMNIEKVST